MMNCFAQWTKRVGIAFLLCILAAYGICPAAQAQRFTVQLMSGTDRPAAESFIAGLSRQGIEAYIAQFEQDGRTLYKVRSGDFATAAEAQALMRGLKEKGLDCWIAAVEAPPQAVQPKAPEPSAQDSAGTGPNGAPAGAAPEPAEPSAQKAEPFVLVINPEPSFPEEPAAVPAPPIPQDPALQPSRTYKYINADDGSVHITGSLARVPLPYRDKISEISIFPVQFDGLDLRLPSVRLKIEGKHQEVVLQGIVHVDRPVAAAAIREFEALLKTSPLRVRYYPDRTDPDGTLHGSLFFKDGTPVEFELVRRGLARCDSDRLPLLQRNACRDAEQAAGRASR